MVRLIYRSRIGNKDEFDRLYMACVNSPYRKIIDKGLVIESSIMITSAYNGIMNGRMLNYADNYPYTVLIND